MQVQGISSIPETRSINNEHNHIIKPPAQIAGQAAPRIAFWPTPHLKTIIFTKSIRRIMKILKILKNSEPQNLQEVVSYDFSWRNKLRPISQQYLFHPFICTSEKDRFTPPSPAVCCAAVKPCRILSMQFFGANKQIRMTLHRPE